MIMYGVCACVCVCARARAFIYNLLIVSNTTKTYMIVN